MTRDSSRPPPLPGRTVLNYHGPSAERADRQIRLMRKRKLLRRAFVAAARTVVLLAAVVAGLVAYTLAVAYMNS